MPQPTKIPSDLGWLLKANLLLSCIYALALAYSIVKGPDLFDLVFYVLGEGVVLFFCLVQWQIYKRRKHSLLVGRVFHASFFFLGVSDIVVASVMGEFNSGHIILGLMVAFNVFGFRTMGASFSKRYLVPETDYEEVFD